MFLRKVNENEPAGVKGYFPLNKGGIIIYVASPVKHGGRLWIRYDLFTGEPSGGEETSDLGYIESERELTQGELEKRAVRIFERVRKNG